ncbi:MAG: hypothetical protein K1X92_13065 [Bacteroidia bacterium]|nr:hypothetical protein [Bacteroidia bacterium]
MLNKGFFVTLLILMGCNTSTVKESPKESNIDMAKTDRGTIYSGHWMDKVFVESLMQKHSVIGIKEIPAIIEIGFLSAKNDSIVINTGKSVEKKAIRFVNDDSITFAKGALRYNKEAGVEQLFWIDSAGVKRAFERIGNDYITNTDSIANTLTAFVNKNTLAGDYFFMDNKGKKTDDFALFKPDGKIIGWDKYVSYTVKMDKESISKTQKKYDVIYLEGNTEPGEFYAWEFYDYDKENEKEENKNKRPKQFGTTLRFYKITDKKPLKEKPDFEFSVNKLAR